MSVARRATSPANAPVAKSTRARNQKRATRSVLAKSTRPQNARNGSNFAGGNESSAGLDIRVETWASLCQALFDAAEFRYLK
jgi:hypothetical protein